MAARSASLAPSTTVETTPTVKKASARIGKNDRNAKYVIAPACCPAFTDPKCSCIRTTWSIQPYRSRRPAIRSLIEAMSALPLRRPL